jgi:hypothetical protein
VATNDLPDWARVIARPDTILAGSPMAYGVGSTSVTVAMPTAVHTLSIVLPDFPNVSEITVVGQITSTNYYTDYPQLNIFQKQYYVLIPEGADTSVTVTITAGVAGHAYLTGVSDTVAVASLPQNPAPWQAPNTPSQYFSFGNPGPNASATIIAAQTNARSIWLHSMWWVWSVTAATVVGTFQDNVSVISGADSAITAGIPRYMDHKGCKLGAGNPFVFKQSGAAAANTSVCYGGVTFSVY